MTRYLVPTVLVLLAGCRTPAAPEKPMASAEAVDPVQREAQVHADLAAAEALIQGLEAQELSAPQRERLLLSQALVADARAALDTGNGTRAAQLAAKALSLAQGIVEG